MGHSNRHEKGLAIDITGSVESLEKLAVILADCINIPYDKDVGIKTVGIEDQYELIWKADPEFNTQLHFAGLEEGSIIWGLKSYVDNKGKPEIKKNYDYKNISISTTLANGRLTDKAIEYIFGKITSEFGKLTGDDICQAIADAGKEFNINPNIIAGIIDYVSGFVPNKSDVEKTQLGIAMIAMELAKTLGLIGQNDQRLNPIKSIKAIGMLLTNGTFGIFLENPKLVIESIFKDYETIKQNIKEKFWEGCPLP